MVHISKKYLDKDLQIKAWGRFLKKIHAVRSTDTIIANLQTFLTSEEITMLEKRLAIPILLKQKESYRTIGKILDVSPGPISFVKHNLTKKPVTHRKYGGTYRSPKKVLREKFLPPYKGGNRFTEKWV